MEPYEMRELVSQVQNGSEIEITFKPGSGPKQILSDQALNLMGDLFDLYRRGKIYVREGLVNRISAIFMSGYFNDDANRILPIRIQQGFDPAFFERLIPALESIQLLETGTIKVEQPTVWKQDLAPVPMTAWHWVLVVALSVLMLWAVGANIDKIFDFVDAVQRFWR